MCRLLSVGTCWKLAGCNIYMSRQRVLTKTCSISDLWGTSVGHKQRCLTVKLQLLSMKCHQIPFSKALLQVTSEQHLWLPQQDPGGELKVSRLARQLL